MSTATVRPTRRAALKTIAGLAAGGGAVAVATRTGSRPAAAVSADDSFLAEDVRVERNDGHLDRVTVAPALTVEWRNYGDGVDGVGVTLSAAIEDEAGFDVLYEHRVEDASTEVESVATEGDDLDAVDGRVDISFDRVDLTATGDAVTTDDFGGDLEADERATTTVELTLRVDVEGRQGEVETALETVPFDVTVHNPDGEASTTGQANTEAE